MIVNVGGLDMTLIEAEEASEIVNQAAERMVSTSGLVLLLRIYEG